MGKNDSQFFKNPYNSVFCDTFNCQNIADYIIGTPEPVESWRQGLRVCKKCAQNIVDSVPKELLPAAVENLKKPESSDKRQYICEICGREFPTSQGLATHCRILHSHSKKLRAVET